MPSIRNIKSYSKPAEEPLKFERLEDIEPSKLPDPIENAFEAFCNTCFKPGEFISICGGMLEEGADKADIGKGETRTAEDWVKPNSKGMSALETTTKCGDRVFVRVNPMVQGGSKQSDVTAYRHVLVECDNGSKEEQYGAIKRLGLPISAIIDSGDKPIHAWVLVNAKDQSSPSLSLYLRAAGRAR